MNVYELAQTYYPRLWDEKRIQALAAAGKLTQEEAAAILTAEEEPERAPASRPGTRCFGIGSRGGCVLGNCGRRGAPAAP